MNLLWENILKRTSQEDSVAYILGQNILFKDLSGHERKFVERIVHERHYRKGEYIFQQGEVGVGMYIIAKGAVDILVSDPRSPSKNDFVITKLERLDFFGELSLVEDSGRRSAAAIASQDSTLIGFFKPDLMEILERNPRVGTKVVFRLAEVLGRRLRETTEKISQLKREMIQLQNDRAT